MRRFLAIVLFLVIHSNAFFVAGGIGDSRMQVKNQIYKPAGIVGLSLETGAFDEPQNISDFSMSLELRRFGYSHHDGEQSVAFWSLGAKPLLWTLRIWRIYFRSYFSVMYVFASDDLGEGIEDIDNESIHGPPFVSLAMGAGIGYKLDEKWQVGLFYDMRYIGLREKETFNSAEAYTFGGLGISVQYHIF
jgi:hypothetical protein